MARSANGRVNGWATRLLIAAAGLTIACLLVVLYLFSPDQYSFYPRCLLHSWTGLQCPGCGGLRAAHHILHGEIGAAFRLNALFVLSLAVGSLAGAGLLLNRVTGKDFLAYFRRPFWIWILAAVLLAFGIGRNMG
jgi:uncharacterized protein DUF2752